MKRPFDLSFYKSHPDCKVETRDGKPVEIIHVEEYDESELPVIAMVGQKPLRRVKCFTDNGYPETEEDNLCLFIVADEPELTEFEKACIELYQNGRDDGFSGNELTDKVLKESATELLSLAREQLVHEGYIIEKKAFHDTAETIDEVLYRNRQHDAVRAYNKGYEEGKLAALKDLPRWTKTNYYHPDQKANHLYYDEKKDMILLDGYYLATNDVKKLPGFKEE